MDFEKIKYFLVLADTLSYTKASQQLFISQSMLSRHIMALEQELGMQLFVRNSRGVSLTSVGSYMKNGLRSIDGEYEAILRQARVIGCGLAGELRLGVISAMGIRRVEPLITKYGRLHPEVTLTLRVVQSPGELRRSLSKEQLDFGFGMRFNSFSADLSSMPVCPSRIKLVSSSLHPLAKAPEGTLSIRDFQDDNFITPVDDISTAHNRLMERCAAVGVVPNVITVPDIMTVMLWVELNRGVTFLHDLNIFNGNPSFVFHQLKDTEPGEQHYIYWNTSCSDPKVLAFIDFLRTELN